MPLCASKDTLCLLHQLKVDYALRVLAFNREIDLPPVAWNNIRLALQAQGVGFFYNWTKKIQCASFFHLIKQSINKYGMTSA